VIGLILLCCALFALSCVSVANSIVDRGRLAAFKKVGQWYQERLEASENEARALAEQLVASGSIVRHAMPTPDPEPGYEYAYDETGLVRERLDPRDLPIA
jgi:hypothetical protein